MHIARHASRHVIIDNVRKALDIEAAGGAVRGDEDGEFAGAEGGEEPAGGGGGGGFGEGGDVGDPGGAEDGEEAREAEGGFVGCGED